MEISEGDKQMLWAEVKKEFPDDEMMQQIHYTRLLHHHQTKDLTSQERISFYNRSKPEGKGRPAGNLS